MPYFKAGMTTAVSIAPIMFKHFFPDWPGGPLLVIYAIIIFLGAMVVFQPDRRFNLVRNPTMDSSFADTFEDGFGSGAFEVSPKGHFRVHILQPSGFWVFRRLHVAYAYNSNSTQPDHGKTWKRGCGLCWKVFNSGIADWCHRDDPKWRELGLSETDLEETRHVYGIFAIPLRRPGRRSKPVSNKITAVLSFDALSPEAAEALKSEYDKFEARQNPQLLERAQWISLYF